MKIVVAYCIVVSTIVTIGVLVISARIGELSPGTVATLFSFWGGELLLLCLKSVLRDKERKTPPSDAEI